MSGRNSYIKVCQKIDNHQIPHHKRRHDENHDSREEESCSELHAELATAVSLEELLVDLALVVKDKVEDAEHQGPLQGSGE